jgi:hypothetical protein
MDIIKLCLRQFTKMKSTEVRFFYESVLGRRISDVQWWRVKKSFIQQGLALTTENLKWVGEFKKVLPHANLSHGILAAYTNAQKLIGSKELIQGEFLTELFNQQGVRIHPSTISRWFRPLGGFRKSKFYPADKLQPIILAALIYKAKLSSKQITRELAEKSK